MDPKAKTIIERHGFLDPDRKKPKHDEIQLWVYNNFRQVLKELWPTTAPFDKSASLNLKLEYPVSDNRYVIGFIDIYWPHAVAVEVKTEIPVIGDLIRQIQFYRNYMGGPCWIVVSPDDRAASILKEQGIYFYKYKSPGELF